MSCRQSTSSLFIIRFYFAQAHQVHSAVWPWYDFAFSPERTTKNMLKSLGCDTNQKALISDMIVEMNRLSEEMVSGTHVEEIAASLGKGKISLLASCHIPLIVAPLLIVWEKVRHHSWPVTVFPQL